jgi:hypothetical protein
MNSVFPQRIPHILLVEEYEQSHLAKIYELDEGQSLKSLQGYPDFKLFIDD